MQVFLANQTVKGVYGDLFLKFFFQKLMKDRDLSRLSGNVDKIVVIGITGGFDHLNKAVFYVTRQRTRPSAAFSALHDAAAGKQQWLGDDTCFFILVHIILFGAALGRTGLVHNLFMQQDHELII